MRICCVSNKVMLGLGESRVFFLLHDCGMGCESGSCRPSGRQGRDRDMYVRTYVGLYRMSR